MSSKTTKGASGEIFLVDTHCHIHDAAFSEKFERKDPDLMITEANEVGVKQLICVGTDVASSVQAVAFCKARKNCYSSLAIHPHEASRVSESELTKQVDQLRAIAIEDPKRLVAIGETGLDYFYHDDEQAHRKQEMLLRAHIELAIELNLPMIFHVREAFEDFFAIFDSYEGVSGVVHSFSATKRELAGILERDLHIGLNGIMTFTKLQEQLSAALTAPLEKIVVETDAPFLTPVPFRGKMCEPKHVVNTVEFLCDLRGESFTEFAAQTTKNAQLLFNL